MQWRVTEQGARAVVEVWRPDDGEGLYKACLTGPAGSYPLGALMPEDGRLFLRRVLSIDCLKSRGAWPVRGVEEELACSFRDRPPAVYWEDEVLRCSAQGLPWHSLRRDGDGFTLSFSFDPRRPFPLVPAFCFARVEGGRLIFSFRKGGFPYISQDPGKANGEIPKQGGKEYDKSNHQGARRTGGSAGL